jgi:hypothetical protein
MEPPAELCDVVGGVFKHIPVFCPSPDVDKQFASLGRHNISGTSSYRNSLNGASWSANCDGKIALDGKGECEWDIKFLDKYFRIKLQIPSRCLPDVLPYGVETPIYLTGRKTFTRTSLYTLKEHIGALRWNERLFCDVGLPVNRFQLSVANTQQDQSEERVDRRRQCWKDHPICHCLSDLYLGSWCRWPGHRAVFGERWRSISPHVAIQNRRGLGRYTCVWSLARRCVLCRVSPKNMQCPSRDWRLRRKATPRRVLISSTPSQRQFQLPCPSRWRQTPLSEASAASPAP